MTLHPDAQAIVDMMAARMPPTDPNLTGSQMRALHEKASRDVIPQTGERVGEVQDLQIPGPQGPIAIRSYRPRGASPSEILPMVVFFHGGGWVLCDLDSHDSLCRRLTNLSGCCFVAVDYRRAPESRFPVPASDAYAAYSWLAANSGTLSCDPSRIAVAGDSAGGNLAAVVALQARESGGHAPTFQVLMCPVLDHPFDRLADEENADGLTAAQAQYFWREYLDDPSQAADWRASPLRATSHAGLPATLIVVASEDRLRYQGEAYARSLSDNGVPVTISVYEGMFHSFLMFMDTLETTDRALTDMAAALREALDPGHTVRSAPIMKPAITALFAE